MSQNYKIVERLKAGRTHYSLGIQMTPSALEIEAASLIQELGEALEPFAGQSLIITNETLMRARAILSKLKEA